MNGGRKQYVPHSVQSEYLREQWARILRTRIDEGRLVRATDLQAGRNMTDEELKLAEREERIFSLVAPNDVHYYPAFFCKSQLVEVAEQVSRRLGALAGVEKWIFFTTPVYRLGDRTPLEALQDGELNLVLQAADNAVSRQGLMG